jgi:TP901 family phage tail tape measure protein
MARFWGALILCTGGVVVSEVLRELVVSLSLNSDNFARNMRTINQQIKEAESGFLLAGAGVEKYEKTINGVKSKLSTLGEVHTHQTRAVEQYSRALVAAHQKIDASYQRQEQMTSRLGAARTQYAQLGTQLASYGMTATDVATRLSDVNDKIAKYSTMANKPLGALQQLDTERTRLLQIQAAQERYKALGEEITKLEGQLKANSKTLQNNADEISKVQTNLNKAKAAVKETESEIKKLSGQLVTMESRWTKAGTALDAFSKKANAVSKAITPAGRNLTRYVTTPILGLGTAAIKSSIDFESAFISVRKTVDATEEEYAQLSEQIKEMSTVVATSADDIAEVTAVAGRLGIQNKYLIDFTRTMIDLQNSTNIDATEGAQELAQFANVSKMAQDQFSNFGAALVDLGNNFPTTEASILSMATRLASAGTQVGLTQSQILGFAAALSSVGLEAEMGGSTFSKALIKMQVAVETGGEALTDFAKVSGLTEQAFVDLWKADPAGAFQAFIVGLSGMSEEGASAIKTLDDIGISEVRLRDTLLRATNATELFANTQTMAASAWKENTALTEEAEKRYGSTASQLINLKNTAQLFAQQIGDDLNPTIRNLAEDANALFQSFQALDEQERMQIIKFGAIAAAAGPTLFAFGKLSKMLSTVTSNIGKFALAVGKAGGGWGGLMKVVGSSPVAWIALTAAVVAGTVALIDYVSGAKAAREAIKAMNDQAKEWQETQSKTIYDTGNDPLARFGLNKSDFEGSVDESKDWLDSLIQTWTDGKGETNEIVRSYVDTFKSGSDEIREAIKARKKIQADLGASDPKNDEYLAQLDEYDKEVERLLKKRQNGFLTDEEKARLDEVIQLRAQIELEYVTGAGGGYDSIRKGVEAEKARLEAEAGGENAVIGVELYADALTAGAQGYQAQVEALNQSYRDQYDAVAAITDKEERDAALKELNARHQESLNAAQAEYNALVSEYAPEAFQSEDTQQAYKDLEKFKELIAEVQADGIVSNDEIVKMKEFTDTLDEGRLASFLDLVAQINEAGLGDLELGSEYGGIQASDLLGGYNSITEFLEAHKGEGFDSLSALFGAAEDEAMRVLVDLGLSPEGQTLKDWLDAEHLVTIANVTVQEGLTVSDIPATGSMYQVTLGEGVSVSDVLASGKVTSAYVVDGVTADGTADANGQMVYVTLADGATVEEVTATGLITNASPAGNLRAKIPGTANITEYTVSGDATPPTPNIKPTFDLSGLDKTAIDAYYAANPDKKPAVEMEIGLKAGWAGLVMSAYNSGTLSVFGPNGAVLEVTPELLSTLSPTDIIRYGTDENGQIETDENGRPIIDVIIVPKLGTREAVEASQELLDEKPDNIFTWLGMTDSAQEDAVEVANTISEIERLKAKIAELKESGEVYDDDGLAISDYQNMLTATEEALYMMLSDLDADDLTAIASGIASIIAAMQSGEMTPEEGAAMLDPFLKLLEASDQYLGVGNDISAGIAEGLKAYSWTTDAATVANDVESALRGAGAFNSQSPANRTKPLGADVAAGIGVGMADADLSWYATQTASRLETALRAAIRQDTMKGIGRNAVLGLGIGILSGTSFVVSAITLVARKAVLAAKRELEIESPSKVFRDEVGRMAVRGIGVGALEESKQQAKVMRNAARYLTDAAQTGIVTGSAYSDNRKTYNQNATSTVHVDRLYVNDKQDVTALAVEIASLTRRRQRGRGRKNA